MKRISRAWPILTMTVLVLVSLLALPAVAFAQHTNGGGSGGGSGTSASSGGGQASSGGGSQSASGVARSPSSDGSSGSSVRSGSSGSGGGHSTPASAWREDGNTSGTAHTRAVSAQGTAQGAVSSNGVGRAALSGGAFQRDNGLSSVPPFSRPRMGTPIGQAVPRSSIPAASGGGATVGFYPYYSGDWGYGSFGYGPYGYGSYYRYGGLAGMGRFDSFGGYGFGLGGYGFGFGGYGFGFGGLDGFDSDYSVLSSYSYAGYGRPYGAYDPYARSSTGSGSSISESNGAFIPDARNETGALRLKVKPDTASVYLDGEFVGLVYKFDGIFQKLHLDGGNHRVEIRAPGYQALTFNVRIEPDHTETYRGELEKDAR